MRQVFTVILLCITFATVHGHVSANAEVRSPGVLGNAALNWAEQHEMNAPYVWGAAGPRSYDCSGAVLAAFGHEGVNLPHNTVAMIESGRLVRTWYPRRGDLAFWGPVGDPYHVEFATAWGGIGFGAETPGWQGRVTWHSWNGFQPSAFYEVVG